MESSYVMATSGLLLERGYDVIRLNFRDHGDSHHLNPGVFHSCRIDEVVGAVAAVAELGERREALFAVTIPEQPGSFRRFCRAIGRRGITEFNYRYANEQEAHVFAGIQLSEGDEERATIIQNLRAKGYAVLDMTDNEMAKMHVRHMVGGRSGNATNEVLYRFEFPERPGALLNFLNTIGQEWNISLFHYRNHGAAYGRVLVGLQVAEKDQARFQISLDNLGYRYWKESSNPVYPMFLGR